MQGLKIREAYQLDESEIIGQGSFAKVIKGRNKKTGKMVAIKIIKKQKMNEEEEILLEREIHIMKHISHPNIVEFYDCFLQEKYIYLVLEYLSGGELYQEICEKEVYSQEEARRIMSPIVDAIRYLHQCGIVHRDLKPENCVFSSKGQDKVIKLIDFGVSQIIPNDTHLMSTAVGTPLYMAPQILSGNKYDQEVDWWSIGIILYVLLCGYPPFESDNETDLLKQIKEGGIKFDADDWSGISEQAQDLVRKLLTIQNSKRIKSEQIINHEWMISQADNSSLKNVQQNIKKFKNKLKQIKNTIKAISIMTNLRINH